MTNYRLIHIRAMRQAVALHRALKTDLSRPIDVYGAISRIGVTIAFEPLKGLSGAYLPKSPETGDIPGILINSRHPASRQRFSAGHELGHHLFDGELIFDQQTEYLPREGHAATEREATAEAFASWFLMPRELVHTMVERVGIKGYPSAEQVYRLSLELGTSYSATAHHLVDLKLLTRQQLQALVAVPPKWIKGQIAVHGPGDSWGDVWRVKRGHEGSTLNARPGDEIVVELDEIPSSGYSWELQDSPEGLRLIQSSFEAPHQIRSRSEPTFGARGTRLVVLRAEEPGNTSVKLVMRHPWEPNQAPVDTFSINLAIEPKLEDVILDAVTA